MRKIETAKQARARLTQIWEDLDAMSRSLSLARLITHIEFAKDNIKDAVKACQRWIEVESVGASTDATGKGCPDTRRDEA